MDEYTVPQPRSSSALKIVLWIVGIGALVFILICGGVVFVGYRFVSKNVSRDPATIREVSASITEIQVQERFPPVFSLSMFGMKMVAYGGNNQDAGSFLMMMEFPSGVQSDPEQMKQQMDQNRRQQAGGSQIHIEETAEKTYTIRGKESKVAISKGSTQEGKKIVQVTAPFQSKQGNMAMLMLMVPEQQWDEDELAALLESMR
jgi:hypothetical protein